MILTSTIKIPLSAGFDPPTCHLMVSVSLANFPYCILVCLPWHSPCDAGVGEEVNTGHVYSTILEVSKAMRILLKLALIHF